MFNQALVVNIHSYACGIFCLCRYGDKTPKSTLARAYATLWMIIGLILMSIITAQVSSTLTADNLQPLGDVFGKKVGRLLEL